MSDIATTVPGAALSHVISGSGAAASGMGAGLGIGGLALGGLGGLILGSVMNGNSPFGNRNNDCAGAAVALGGLEFMEQMGDIKVSIANGTASSTAAVLAGAGNLSTAIASGNLTTLQSINQLQSNLQAADTQALITSLQSFNALQASTTAGFTATAAAAAESSNDIKLQLASMTAQAAAVAASQALALQQCCCDQKILAIENTQKILDQNANFRVQDLQTENSNLRQTISLRDSLDASVRTILGHLIPQVATVRTV